MNEPSGTRGQPMEASRRQLETKLDELFAGGPTGSVWVMDVACGAGPATGVLIERLARLCPASRRLSLDCDLSKLAMARPLVAGLPRGNRGWLCADLYALPLPAGAIDYIVACNIFHGVNRGRFGQEMSRVLHPGGRILLYDRVPQLLPFSRLALILDHSQLAALGRLVPAE